MISKIFNSLEGSWNFSRIISQQGAVVQGIARFTRQEQNTLLYREEGQLTMSDGTVFPISQEYLYRHAKDQISVFFAKASTELLHTLNFERSYTASGMHQCAKDAYHARYNFSQLEQNRFHLVYEVKGPKKNFQIETIFERNTGVS